MRVSACDLSFSCCAAAVALASATPVFAQDYEYAQPLPEADITFRSDPVVQALPGTPAPSSDYYVEEPAATALPSLPPPMTRRPDIHPVAYPPVHPGAYAPRVDYQPYPHPDQGYRGPAFFDRDAWIGDCHDRIRGVPRRERAGVIGALLGAVFGGVIGNRAWDSERLGGTLLGAGVGGVAGAAIGSAVEAAGDRRREDECAMYLDRYMSGAYSTAGYPPYYGYGYPGHAYGYGGGYALVPVLVAIPQRQVVRETVTEEWVKEPVRTRTIHRSRSVPSPRPDKRIKMIKGR
ncbi:hypothetical protein GCM10011515_24330 [Tsuneonella deserti]|uniref:17 kDa surface antigen n=1 Tax=Tsuneonella deserti TaxID=2035528 RepID=A0ABQ1SCG8_9SPHN|nr:glycine zipper 2TM domain-containing protein [Tsuneonella deserti]GGE03819.1 hypothetical protein GCM10011515_24330 [Tsuneonella deserti]